MTWKLGSGKTPLARSVAGTRSVAVTLCRYWINKLGKADEIAPSFRQASQFDVSAVPR